MSCTGRVPAVNSLYFHTVAVFQHFIDLYDGVLSMSARSLFIPIIYIYTFYGKDSMKKKLYVMDIVNIIVNEINNLKKNNFFQKKLEDRL